MKLEHRQATEDQKEEWSMRLCAMCAAFTLCLTTLSDASAQSSQTMTYYQTDFESPAGAEWSHSQIDITPVGDRKFLGQFGNDEVMLSLSGLPLHDMLQIDFDLYIIRSWDGDSDSDGPDRYIMSLQTGPVLLDTTFSNHMPGTGPKSYQSYPDTYPAGNHLACDGAVEYGTLGYSWTYTYGDSVYHLSFTVDHTADNVAFVFAGLGLQELDDESWGLDNVVVRLGGVPEPATLSLLALGGLAVIRRRRK